MFVRTKKSGTYEYLQIVENQRIDGQVRQRVIATLGRLDVLQATGKIDALLSSCARFAEKVSVLDAHKRGQLPPAETIKIGPPKVFGRLWEQIGIKRIVKELLRERKYEFDVERVIFMTVLHRLMVSGSDRTAEQWCRGYAIEGIDDIELHHIYRAMAWLGEPLPRRKQAGATPFAPRCIKDMIEESLFAQRRDLFSGLDLVFFDTTSIYFEGQGGETIGQYGNSKDHRPDLKQMVVGAVLDGSGHPICCELWPGNTADVKSLIPIVDRLRKRFGIGRICIVADRGMISKDTIAELQKKVRDVRYILGARMRLVKEIRAVVLSDTSPFESVYGPKQTGKNPSPLEVKEVKVQSRRYLVCRNEDQARKDLADREAIVKSLREQLKRGDKSLVGNKGYRKYLKTPSGGQHFKIDEDKVRDEARYDGIWVLQTDLDISSKDVALRYKELWMVESIFRTIKSILANRPIFHKCDETIRGHVFCSFLALILVKELQNRMSERGWNAEWDRLKDDLDNLEEITVGATGKAFVIRSETRGDAGKAIQATGVALGSVIRPLGEQ
jgi:transposase